MVILFAEKYLVAKRRKDDKFTKQLDGAIALLSLFLLSSFSVSTIFYVYKPHTVCNFGNLVPTNAPKILVYLAIIPLLFANLVYHCNLWMTVVFIFLVLAIFFQLVLREIKLGKLGTFYILKDQVRKPEDLALVYRSAHMIFCRVNLWIGKIFIVTHAVATMFFVVGVSIAMKFYDRLSTTKICLLLMWTFAVAIVWTILLLFGGHLHLHTTKAIASWKRNQWKSRMERKVMLKFSKSCKPIYLGYGKLFQMKNISVLVYLKGISRGILRALLTSRKYP